MSGSDGSLQLAQRRCPHQSDSRKGEAVSRFRAQSDRWVLQVRQRLALENHAFSLRPFPEAVKWDDNGPSSGSRVD